MSLQVGDLVRISVGLMRDLYEQPVHQSAVVRLASVTVNPDGTKVLHFETVLEQQP